jgi:plasmid maintenance system antidote protein VapI
MPRKRVEPNPLSGERIKKLLNGHKVDGKRATQEWLAEELNITSVYLSDIVRGKKRLPPELAIKIAKLFPPTRIEWLLGEDDFQTEGMRFMDEMAMMRHEGNLLFTGLCAFAELTDYKITPLYLRSGSFEELFDAMKQAYRMTKGDQDITLSLEEMNQFENEVCDFVELKLKHLFKQKGVDL